MTASRPLSPATLIQARGIARACWIESDSDPETAESLFSGRYPGVEQRTVALDLFQHWIDRKVHEPDLMITTDEAELIGLGSE